MNIQNIDPRNLYKDVLISCWMIIGIYAIGTSIELCFTTYEPMKFLKYAIFIPILKMAALNAIMGWVFRKEGPFTKYLLIVGINLFICIIIFSLYNIPFLIYCLIIPILLSLYFFSRRLILFALIQSILTVTIIFFFSPTIREQLNSDNFIMLLSLLASTALIINNLRKHAFSLFQELVKVIQEKQNLQTKNEIMEQLNRVDSATGLYNHRSFHEHLASVIDKPEAHTLPVHLAILDIDNFKRVNDTFGHAAGDDVIKFVAKQLSIAMDHQDFVSRYGGEEFSIICTEKSTERFVEQLEAIRRSIAREKLEQLNRESITISIGVQKLRSGMTKEELFQQADEALYLAKKSGKNQTIIAK